METVPADVLTSLSSDLFGWVLAMFVICGASLAALVFLLRYLSDAMEN